MPRDLRDDTTLHADPERPGRFHAHIPDAWKVVYIFGGVSMYAALRAMEQQLGRDDLSLVTANAIFLAPVPPGSDHDRRRRAARRPAGVTGRGRPPRPGRRSARRCACTACSAPRTTPSTRIKRCGSPRCRARPTSRCRPSARIRSARSTSTSRPNGGPASPLDDPGKGHFLSWVRLRESEPHLLSLAVHGDVLGPGGGARARPARRERHVHGAVARDRHPLRAGAGDVVGAAGDRGLAHRRRLRHRPRPPVGRRRQSLRDRHADREPAAARTLPQ